MNSKTKYIGPNEMIKNKSYSICLFIFYFQKKKENNYFSLKMNRANAKSNSIKRNEFEAYASERRPIMNFSDLIEDKTIHVEKSSISSSPPFEPNEISGRSTGTALTEDVDCDQFSVDDILGASFVQEIRHITKQCDRQSLQINRPTSNSSVNSFTWNRSKLPNPPTYSDSLTDECFEPAEKVNF